MVRTGEVLAYDPKLGWGHIRPDDLSANVFAHHTALRCARGFRKLVPGQRVEYEARERPDGKPEAVLVTGPHGAFLDDPVLPCAPPDAPGDLPKARKLMVPRVVACPRALPAARAAPSLSACPPASARRPASREAGSEPRAVGAALGDAREGGGGERAARRAKARGKKRGGQRGAEERPPAPAACAEPVEPQAEGEPSKKRRKKRAAKG
ncbi:hypothetical protein AB1Y20_006097 [Prymnesium parvum]|uniref:CSD domain-containing protein n=1 Tax=Prymnesium parvum TaxID=97485 RepID=A0AB34J1M2_PRYPA